MKRARIRYTARQMAWLTANRMMVISDYHRAFCAKFRRGDVSMDNLKGLRTRKGWKVGRDGDRYRGRRSKYSAKQLAWLSENRTLPVFDYHQKFSARFRDFSVTVKALQALRKRKGWKTGRTGCFPKGHLPANKGKPFLVAKKNPNCRRNQFKKGQHPHNTKFAGHEYVDGDGYVLISVNETNPHTGFERRYVFKHRWLWEKKNGPVPQGHGLKCLDGNKQNIKLSNWKCLPRAVLARLNGGPQKKRVSYDDAPAELKPLILAAAELAYRAKKTRQQKAA